jgi:hypothetical protein
MIQFLMKVSGFEFLTHWKFSLILA